MVGAGFAGLATALHLLGAGRRVTILERGEHPGGRAGRLDLTTAEGTYRVDTGPTVLTMPELFAEAFAAVGEKLEERLDLVELDPAYRTHFADGSTIDVHADAGAMEAEVRAVCGPAAATGYVRMREWLTQLYRAEIDTFIGADFDSPLDLLGPDLVRLAALGGFGRLAPLVEKLLPDERLQRIFSFQALYAGVPPQTALGAYGVIAYMDTIAGVFFPRGGMRTVGQALADAAVAAGAEIHYGRTVTGLEQGVGSTRGRRVTAVRHRPTDDRLADTDRTPSDAVVLTPDLPAVHDLLGRAPRRIVPLRYSPSAVVLHAGLRSTRTDAAHHTISFGAAWRDTFREIIDDGVPMSDPSLLITRPTATDPSLAPDGRDLLFVLAPCPNLDAGPIDWPRVGPRYRDEILGVLEARGHPGLGDIEGDIEVSHLVTPADWAAQGMAAGTPFSAAHTFAQTGPFRPRNLVRGVDNVVLAGCGTTPGVGIPPVLISGRLAAARITGPQVGPGPRVPTGR
ncbi:MAG: phytoene desaturase family protein [Pseudonocardia sp.]|nr:phytoene desaturase family protein [Pseudonocardia sp.]